MRNIIWVHCVVCAFCICGLMLSVSVERLAVTTARFYHFSGISGNLEMSENSAKVREKSGIFFCVESGNPGPPPKRTKLFPVGA